MKRNGIGGALRISGIWILVGAVAITAATFAFAPFLLSKAAEPDSGGLRVKAAKETRVTFGGAYRDVYSAMRALGLRDRKAAQAEESVRTNGDANGLFPMGGADATLREDAVSSGDIADGNAPIPEDIGGASSEHPVFADTNTQVAGVQEADVIKTDGRYIYAINNQRLSVIEANSGHPNVIGEISQRVDEGQVYFEMYITEGRLIALRQGYNNIKTDATESGEIPPAAAR
ncbi:MAG: beta-propeller domain-containing protein, partial [Clostridiales Family XIII bacterium]|nr:beta-propeller domain-containing protein [Clostridiales Family XIII bacterium]